MLYVHTYTYEDDWGSSQDRNNRIEGQKGRERERERERNRQISFPYHNARIKTRKNVEKYRVYCKKVLQTAMESNEKLKFLGAERNPF